MILNDFESALAKFRSDATAEDLRQAIRSLEAKFDRNQPRAPAGNPNGGQWVDTGQGGASGPRKPPRTTGPRLAARRVARAVGLLARNPELAPLAQAVGLPVVVGGVALTRAVGDFDRQTTGREKTPFLNLPTEKLDLRITSNDRPIASGANGGGFHRSERVRIDEECDELENDDQIKCSTYAAMYGRSKADQRRIARVCLSTVAERAAECRNNGGVSGVNTPLFMGRR